ncbi:MAG: hypothetical protein JWL63_2439 [Rhodocyclales bacterium]|nr:hypothetical protein [Rhodocyclales bacterium]
MLKYLKLIAVAAIAVSLTACAGFRTGDLGKVEGWSTATDVQKKKSISYTLTMQTQKDETVTPQPGAGIAFDNIKKELDAAFADSGLFNSVKSDGSVATTQIAVKTTQSGWGSPILAMISGATFGVIPAFANDTFAVSMTFKDADSKELGTIEKSEGVTMVIHLVMIPLMPFKFPFSEVENSHKDIYRAILKEAQTKGFI